MEKTKETERYSNAKTHMLPKQDLRKFAKNECCLKFVKTNSKEKDKKIIVPIKNFQFNKGRANKTIGLRRMLERNML